MGVDYYLCKIIIGFEIIVVLQEVVFYLKSYRIFYCSSFLNRNSFVFKNIDVIFCQISQRYIVSMYYFAGIKCKTIIV